jgi:MoxR-like ATPase
MTYYFKIVKKLFKDVFFSYLFMREKKQKIEKDLISESYQKKIFDEDLNNSFAICHKKIHLAREEIEKIVKGQKDIILSLIHAIICRGHILFEGLPGLGKTVLCRTFAVISQLDFKRVQFTTDLLPSDIIGMMTYDKVKGFDIVKGPIFSNLLLADEINRAPPKVQSALLEAMGERQVTLGKQTHILENPFLVLATQNPIEQGGTFPLPEAQLDRFLFKVIINYPDFDAEYNIMNNNLNTKQMNEFNINSVLSRDDIIAMQGLVHLVHVDMRLKEYILNIVRGTRNPYEIQLSRASFIKIGGSPRASINILVACKAQALIDGRNYVIPKDIKKVIYNVLRHRIYLNFQSNLAKITTDDVITEILEKISIY